MNKTQQGWTRLNKLVKCSEHFTLNKCLVLFSEMFSTFDQGLTSHPKYFDAGRVITLSVRFDFLTYSRWFRYERDTNLKQSTRLNFDVGLCRPILPYNQILCVHDFNLRSLYFQSLQSLPNWIQLHTSETSSVCTSFQWINNNNTIPTVTVFY